MPLKRQQKSGSVKIALADCVKNTFNISVLFDSFSDILDKSFLPHFVSFQFSLYLSSEY